jgi:5'-nucleotidase
VHISGAVITYDSTRAAGSRLVSVRMLDGKDLRDDAQYVLVLNDFLATGGDGLGVTAGALHSEILTMVDLDAFVEYVRTLPQPVRAPQDVRILAAPGGR